MRGVMPNHEKAGDSSKPVGPGQTALGDVRVHRIAPLVICGAMDTRVALAIALILGAFQARYEPEKVLTS